MGEGTSLRDDQRFVLFRETVRIVKGRAVVIANISDTGTQRVLDLVELAAKAKVDCAAMTPRFGLPQRNPGETLGHIKAVAARARVPVWFYENPYVTQVTSTFEQIAEAVALPNVTGMKLSSPDRDLFTRCVKELQPEAPVLTGNATDVAYAGSIGAQGAVAGMGSLAPRLCVELFEAGCKEQADRAKQLQQEMDSTYGIYGGEGWPLWPSAQKYVLKKLGVLKTDYSTAPFVRLGRQEKAVIDAALEKIDAKVFEV